MFYIHKLDTTYPSNIEEAMENIMETALLDWLGIYFPNDIKGWYPINTNIPTIPDIRGMKKLILLLVVLATSCNQEANTKYFMHKYVGDYTATITATYESADGKVESGTASIEKINGEYYLTLDQLMNIKLDSTSRENIVHDSLGVMQ